MKGIEKVTVSNSIIFLRHAETTIDSSIPPYDWSITENGLQQARRLAKSDIFSNIEGIVHSSEKKARQTADAFAEELHADLYEIPEFDELRRQDNMLPSQEYRTLIRGVLTSWERRLSGWESGSDALNRFAQGVKRLGIMFYSRNILVISHGLVLTLYFCQLRNLQSIAYERWTQMPFLAWGLVRDGRVLIDIL